MRVPEFRVESDLPKTFHKFSQYSSLSGETPRLNIFLHSSAWVSKCCHSSLPFCLLRIEFFFPARANHTSRPRNQSAYDMSSSTQNTRARSPTQGETDDERSKRYILVSNLPRHTAGGLLSSWLVDQHLTKDGGGYTIYCVPPPRVLDGHHAAFWPVLIPGMVPDSLTSMGRNTLCWVDVSHYDGESCQRTLAREGARVLKVKVSRPHYKVNGSHRTQLTTSPRLPSQELIHTTSYTESIPVLTDLRFKLGDGTFTLPPIHGTATSTQQNPTSNGTEVMEESQELKDNEENYEEATQRALDIQIWEDFVERDERGRISAMRRMPTPSLAPTPPKHASIYWPRSQRTQKSPELLSTNGSNPSQR